ncbi:MAG: hypothetical protein R6U89_02260 [Dehalococcoidia bacterium]
MIWSKRYEAEVTFSGAMVVDDNGNVYITGGTLSGKSDETMDYVTIKYDAEGEQSWVSRYDGGGLDQSIAMTLDSNGNVYVTGQSAKNQFASTYDYATVKYDNNGFELWAVRYKTPEESGYGASSIALDEFGNVYVSGVAGTIKYDQWGKQLWVNDSDTLDIRDVYQPKLGLVLDEKGNSYVLRNTSLVKYSPDGKRLWGADSIKSSGTNAILHTVALDRDSNVYIAGWIENKPNTGKPGYHSYTAKYNTYGEQLWMALYQPEADCNTVAKAMLIDEAGGVYIAGTSCNRYLTIKYDHDGNKIWTSQFKDPNPEASASGKTIALDDHKNVYILGNSYVPDDRYYVTIVKYSQ